MELTVHNPLEQRVLVYAPVGKDARLIAEVLEKAQVNNQICPSLKELQQAAECGVGAIFLTEEGFREPAHVDILFKLVQQQPTWSDLPLIVSYSKSHTLSKTLLHSLKYLDDRSSLTLLERPMNPHLLVSAVRSALKSRIRQYERRRAEAERQKLLDELEVARQRAESSSMKIGAALEREKESRQAAEDANRSKDIFLATLSHELRTPLNAILGFSEILPYEVPGSAEFDSALATIVRNAKAQSDLIDDILDVSRIISGKLAIEKAPIDLVKMVRETVESFQIAARQKEITLHLVSDTRTQSLPGDAKRLQQVFWNLLSNAIKFSPSGSEVRVEIQTKNQWLDVCVIDQGEGIDKDFLPFIFDRFRQQDGSFTRRFGGLGLGLSIVRHLVEAHEGVIKAESEGPGRGAKFVVTLPLAANVAELPLLIGDRSAIAGMDRDVKGRVLIVDDQMDNRSLVSIVLRRAGYEVVETDSASGARKALGESNFDALVCDIGMPEEDGLSFILRLRASISPRLFGLPAAALSGFVSEDDKRRALRAGFDLHLSKPIQPKEVVTAVNKLITLRRTVPSSSYSPENLDE